MHIRGVVYTSSRREGAGSARLGSAGWFGKDGPISPARAAGEDRSLGTGLTQNPGPAGTKLC